MCRLSRRDNVTIIDGERREKIYLENIKVVLGLAVRAATNWNASDPVMCTWWRKEKLMKIRESIPGPVSDEAVILLSWEPGAHLRHEILRSGCS